ncbi:MAG: hypothetical protein ACYC69_13780 [Thermodesulfovibrionales bacterium]
MDQGPEKEAVQKKPYLAPTVMVVHLTPEEVSLGACKALFSSVGSRSPGQLCSLCGGALGS